MLFRLETRSHYLKVFEMYSHIVQFPLSFPEVIRGILFGFDTISIRRGNWSLAT